MDVLVHYQAAFLPGQGEVAVAWALRHDAGAEVVDLTQYVGLPWAPFADLALASPAGRVKPYFRHAPLFLGQGDEASEPLIDEEITYELGRLADTLVDRLGALGPRTLVLRHGELLGPEAYYLLERLRNGPERPLRVVVCWEGPLAEWERFKQLDALGYVSWDSSGPPGEPPGPSTVVVEPTAAQRRELLRWLCFETVGQLTSEEATLDRLEALAATGGFEVGIELGEALVRRLPPTAVADLHRARISLARLYRQAGDTALAARSLSLGWTQARSQTKAEAARIDFLLFETSYRTLVVEDVYLGLEERLVAALEALGWWNHLAYVLTKNVWIQTVGRTQGWDEAQRLWRRGRALVTRSGNQRRLAVALQTRGSLLAIEGRLPQALVTTRRAVTIALQHSSPLHAAKVENGLGYLEFTAGHYRRAWEHHRRALELLPETRDHQEYVGTLVNLGRLYLLNDQPDRALPLLTTALRAMEGLGLSDLAFHPKANTHALEAVCCLKLGQVGRAQEFLRKLRADEASTGRLNEHRLCLEVLLAQHQRDHERARTQLATALSYFSQRVADLRHLLLWLLKESGAWYRSLHDEDQAHVHWDQAEALLPAAPLGGDLRRQLEALRSGVPRRGGALPPLKWDSPLLVRFSKQESALRLLRRTVQDYGFLQVWNQALLPGTPVADLFLTAVVLVRTHFPVDTVAVLEGASDEVLALAPGSDPELIAKPQRATVFETFPLSHSGRVQARLVCIDSHLEPLFGRSDRRVLDLAADHLAVLLLSQHRAQDLEERSTHLARALEVLGETQEKLVRSENLAVLGTLSAGLAHELNTPLGAILSSSRTVHSLITGPLATLVDAFSPEQDRVREVYRVLLSRITAREASLGPVDRTLRRQVRQDLEALGALEPDMQADLWFEVGLGGDRDLQAQYGLEPGIVSALESLVSVSQGHRLTRVIEEAANRAASVVSTLRSYLQGGEEASVSVFELDEELEGVLAVLGVSRWRSLVVERQIPAHLRMMGRRLPLAQVWTNLIQNAIQAMEGKGTLTLTARRDAGRIVVEVGDNGPGIPVAHREKIFRPFFSTKKQTGGLGLGLDITRRIVEGHQGHLEFESRPGHTVFRVFLPGEENRPWPT